MFEQTAASTSRVIYWLAIALGAVGLAWVFFANMPFWLALCLYPFALALGVMLLAPVAAVVAWLVGLAAGLIALIGRPFSSRRRSVS